MHRFLKCTLAVLFSPAKSFATWRIQIWLDQSTKTWVISWFMETALIWHCSFWAFSCNDQKNKERLAFKACLISCAKPIASRSENTCSAPSGQHFITWFYKRWPKDKPYPEICEWITHFRSYSYNWLKINARFGHALGRLGKNLAVLRSPWRPSSRQAQPAGAASRDQFPERLGLI